MNPLFENIENRLNEDLIGLQTLPPLERYNASIILINKAITEVKEQLGTHEFESPGDEIFFFKEIRPKIIAFKIRVSLEYNIKINEPIGTKENIVLYFEEAMKGLQSIFRLNSFYYQYYRNHFTELDHLYFIRNADHSLIPLPEATDPDHHDTTPMSDLFTKFIAYEYVNHQLIQKISTLMNGSESRCNDTGVELRWTGDVINVVELAYGLWLTGQINDGNASLNQIVRWLEINLKVNIGIAQRKFSEIAGRKRLSITKFMDQMSKAIRDKIDQLTR